MSRRALLAGGRKANARLGAFADRGTVSRAGERTFDPETGKYEIPQIPVYVGSCRVKPLATSQEVQGGERQVVLRQYDVTFPWGAPQLQRDDVLTLDTCEDAWLVGRPLHAMEVVYGGGKAAHHVVFEDRT